MTYENNVYLYVNTCFRPINRHSLGPYLVQSYIKQFIHTNVSCHTAAKCLAEFLRLVLDRTRYCIKCTYYECIYYLWIEHWEFWPVLSTSLREVKNHINKTHQKMFKPDFIVPWNFTSLAPGFIFIII